jgi:hypothetical protein
MNVNIRGLSSVLIGLLAIEYIDVQESTPGTYTRENLYDALITRVGMEKFEERWKEFTTSLDFQKAEKGNKFKDNFDLEFTQFIHESISF